MNETNIIKELYRHFANHEYLLRNVLIFNWESDFFAVSTSGYTIEVEVKISKGDFKADFKKSEKHHILQNADKEIISITKWNHTYDVKPFAPNKFYYCCPDGLINSNDIPDYAGLLYLKDSGKSWSHEALVEVKRAKFLHKKQPDISKILLSKYYHMYLNARAEYNDLLQRVNEIERHFDYEKTKGLSKLIDEPKVYEQKVIW